MPLNRGLAGFGLNQSKLPINWALALNMTICICVSDLNSVIDLHRLSSLRAFANLSLVWLTLMSK